MARPPAAPVDGAAKMFDSNITVQSRDPSGNVPMEVRTDQPMLAPASSITTSVEPRSGITRQTVDHLARDDKRARLQQCVYSLWSRQSTGSTVVGSELAGNLVSVTSMLHAPSLYQDDSEAPAYTTELGFFTCSSCLEQKMSPRQGRRTLD